MNPADLPADVVCWIQADAYLAAASWVDCQDDADALRATADELYREAYLLLRERAEQ